MSVSKPHNRNHPLIPSKPKTCPACRQPVDGTGAYCSKCEAAKPLFEEGAAMAKVKATKAPTKKAKKAVEKIMATIGAKKAPEVPQVAPVNEQPADVRKCRVCQLPIQARYTKAYAEGVHAACDKFGATTRRVAQMEAKS